MSTEYDCHDAIFGALCVGQMPVKIAEFFKYLKLTTSSVDERVNEAKVER